MASNIKTSIQNFKLVFSNKRYILLSICVALFFYVLNVFIFDYKYFFHAFPEYGLVGGSKFIFNLLLYFYQTIRLTSFFTIITISILFGILFSLIIYKTKFANQTKEKKNGVLGIFGIFLGVLAPGCAACGVGLVSLLGLNAAFLSFFPYDGFELSFLAIIMLIYTTLHLSRNLTVCKVK